MLERRDRFYIKLVNSITQCEKTVHKQWKIQTIEPPVEIWFPSIITVALSTLGSLRIECSGEKWTGRVEDNRRRGGKLKGAEQGNMSISGYDPVNPGKWRDAQTHGEPRSMVISRILLGQEPCVSLYQISNSIILIINNSIVLFTFT